MIKYTSPADDSYLYERNYFDEHYLNDPKREAMYKQEYKRICELRPDGGFVLDVGCGNGAFLEIFSDRWKKFGYEPSDFAREAAIKRGVTAIRGIHAMESCSMEVVIFRGTLQHIGTPMQTLLQAMRVLVPGGLLVILATPDTDSIVYKIWGDLPALEPARNWVLFGHKNFTNILRRLGLEVIKINHPYWGTPYARPLADAIKFIWSLFFGFRKFAWPGNMMEIYAVKK